MSKKSNKIEEVSLRGAKLTHKAILAAARQYKTINGWKTAKSQKFVLIVDGQEFPPKKIASLAANIPVSQFSGGAELNDKLRRLGFEIKNK